jgi:hypothetical protein
MLVVGVSVVLANEINDNFDFEDGTSGWTILNKNGDKVVCSGDKNHQAKNNDCSFLFSSTPGYQATLYQKMNGSDLDEVNDRLSDGTEELVFETYRRSGSAASKLNVKITVNYVDNTKEVIKVSDAGVTLDFRRDDWNLVKTEGNIIDQDDLIQSVVLRITDASTARGKQWIDMTRLYFND